MTKEKYMESLAADPDEIELEKVDIIVWLNTLVDAMNFMRDNYYELSWGKLDKEAGEYEYNIQPCSLSPYDYRGLHIYKGIEFLAAAVGRELLVEPFGFDAVCLNYKYKFYFNYKGVEVFQIEKEETLTK